MKIFSKKNVPHFVAIMLFIILPSLYFSPIFEGKTLAQGDMLKAEGASKQQKDYYEETGNKTWWNSYMFSGMPSYQIYGKTPASLTFLVGKVIYSSEWGYHIFIVFFYLLAAYIALILLGCSPWLSLLGSFAIAFSSYQIIIIEAGHVSKGWTISLMLPIIVGMLLCLKQKLLSGGLLFTIALSFQLYFNHIQITYYTLICCVILALFYIGKTISTHQYKSLFKAGGVLLVGALFAVAFHSPYLISNNEYLKYTMRGGSELTISPDQDIQVKKSASGLDIDYAYNWSYGIGETFTTLVPGVYGGSSNEHVGKGSEFYKATNQQYAPLYWGDQPFTSGPMYFGAIICFLFVFAFFVTKGIEKWWILSGVIFMMLLAWGKNLIWFNEFIFNYLPLYNKFRSPSTCLVGSNILMVLLAVLGLKSLMENTFTKEKLNKALYWSTGIVGGLCLIFIVFGGSLFSFTGISDIEYEKNMNPEQFKMFIDILISDRKALLVSDSFRSLIFIILSAGILWSFVNQKIKKQGIILALLSLLVLVDLWGVDKRYLNEKNFVSSKKMKLHPTQNDLLIKQYAQQYNDKIYRVYNLAGNPFNDSYTSAFHYSIGGYHAAKMRRYQDLIDFYLVKGNMNVINMLNTRYLILSDGKGGSFVQRNPDALGNAWFVGDYKLVNNADEEILALKDVNPSETVVIDKWFSDQINQYAKGYDSTAEITLVTDQLYNPEKLVYKTKSGRDQLAVFSEIYYEPDWQVFIDGKPANYFRANYVLRGMIVPKGEHTIEFKLITKSYNRASVFSTLASIVFVLLIVGIVYYEKKKKPLIQLKKQ